MSTIALIEPATDEEIADWESRAPHSDVLSLIARIKADATELTTLKARITAVEASRDFYAKMCGERMAECELAEAQRDEALKALAPFAYRVPASKLNSDADDMELVALAGCELGSFRAARNAMGEPTE